MHSSLCIPGALEQRFCISIPVHSTQQLLLTEKTLRARTAWLLALTSSALALSGCSAPAPTPTTQAPTNTTRNTAVGAAVGAVAGAGVAHATGGKAAVGAVAGAAVGGTVAYLWSRNMERQRLELERATKGTGVKVSRTDDNRLKMVFPADITFNSHSAELQPQARTLLSRFADSLKRHPTTHVLIVGHADSSGGPHINDPLSKDRANAARNYIFQQKVMGPRIQTEGRGAREPVASNDTPAGRAKNRRVEVFVMEQRR